MNARECREMTYFPKALDKAINDKFGKEVEAHTEFDLLGTGNYVTYYKAEGIQKELIEAYIEGWKAGNIELRERLCNLPKK